MSQSEKNADLSNAIRQLETLLDAQSGSEGQDGDKLPVLDEIVDAEDADGFDETFDLTTAGASSSSTAQPDPDQIRAVLERVAEQMEIELGKVSGMLKRNMLKEFRNELAAALNMDPQQLDPHNSGQDNTKS